MSKIIFTIAWLFLASIYARAADSEVQLYPRYTYNASRFNVATNLKSSYSGWDLGGNLLLRYKGNKEYGLGVGIGYDSQSLDNSANTTAESETMEGSLVSFMGRFYGLNLFVGFGFLYNNFEIKYKLNGTTTATKYTGLGVRFETGMDVPLGKTFLFAPKLHYDIMNVNTTGSGSNQIKRLNSFGIGAGLGFAF